MFHSIPGQTHQTLAPLRGILATDASVNRYQLPYQCTSLTSFRSLLTVLIFLSFLFHIIVLMVLPPVDSRYHLLMIICRHSLNAYTICIVFALYKLLTSYVSCYAQWLTFRFFRFSSCLLVNVPHLSFLVGDFTVKGKNLHVKMRHKDNIDLIMLINVRVCKNKEACGLTFWEMMFHHS